LAKDAADRLRFRRHSPTGVGVCRMRIDIADLRASGIGSSARRNGAFPPLARGPATMYHVSPGLPDVAGIAGNFGIDVARGPWRAHALRAQHGRQPPDNTKHRSRLASKRHALAVSAGASLYLLLHQRPMAFQNEGTDSVHQSSSSARANCEHHVSCALAPNMIWFGRVTDAMQRSRAGRVVIEYVDAFAILRRAVDRSRADGGATCFWHGNGPIRLVHAPVVAHDIMPVKQRRVGRRPAGRPPNRAGARAADLSSLRPASRSLDCIAI